MTRSESTPRTPRQAPGRIGPRWSLLACAAVMLLTPKLFAANVLLDQAWDPGDRWMDIADNVYGGAFQDAQNGFTYAGSDVLLTFADSGETFAGDITAAAGMLKPNFAYQLKLEGKPTLSYGAAGDDWSNEQIGYLGRWWLTVVSTRDGSVITQGNSNDAEYEYWKARNFKDKRRKREYIFAGYLLFGYVVTDGQGVLADAFALDSSFHVLWKTGQGAARPGIDSVPTSHVIDPAMATAYPNPDTVDTGPIEIWGEWEPTRPYPGEVVMPDGDYNVMFLLTEESFHSSGIGGSWDTVLYADPVTFTVAPPPPDYDVAVTAVTAPGSVPVDATVTVTVSVANEGLEAATFSVTLTDVTAGSVIGTDSIDLLPPGASDDLTFEWNTTDASLGDHVLTAAADLVGDEDPADDEGSTIANVYDPNAQYGSVSGVVTSAKNGRPVGGALIEVRNSQGQLVGSAETDGKGRYTVDSVLYGTYDVTCSKKRSSDTATVVVDGAETVDFIL